LVAWVSHIQMGQHLTPFAFKSNEVVLVSQLSRSKALFRPFARKRVLNLDWVSVGENCRVRRLSISSHAVGRW